MPAIFEALLNSLLAQSLGWTIVHSLWQAGAVAFVLWLVLKLFKNSSSQWKYTAGVVALIGLVLISTLTFSVVWRSLDQAGVSQGDIPSSMVAGHAAAPVSASLLEVLRQFVDRHMQLLVFFWAIGVVFLILRMAGGLFYNHRLKIKDVSLASEFWQEKLDGLCRSAGLVKQVVLKESLLAGVPMTIGHIKPVIFFPLGVLTGLPAEQVEALLAHELAHIVRSDYLVNIFQGFVDIFYFYHPAVYWISGLVRQEREHCCDDMAVGMLGDSFHFARALANVHSWSHRDAAYAMTLAKDQHRLFNRIRRIINMKKEGTHSFEGFVGACVLGVLLIITGFSLGTAGVLADNAGNARAVQQEKEKSIETVHVAEEIVKLRKVFQDIVEKIKVLETKDSALTSEEQKELELLRKKAQYVKQKIKTYYKEHQKEMEKDKEKIRMKRLKDMEMKKLELEKLYKRKQALESEKKLSKKQKEELEKITALLAERKRELKEAMIVAEEKRQASLAARKRMLEEKLQKVTIIIQELEAKEGDLTKENQKKLQKFRQLRESLLTEIKK